MKLKVFCVFDSKISLHLQPFFFPATGQALRAFEEAVSDSKTSFAKYPADFTLLEIGTYEESTGLFEMLPVKINLGTALEYIRPSNNDASMLPMSGLNAVKMKGGA